MIVPNKLYYLRMPKHGQGTLGRWILVISLATIWSANLSAEILNFSSSQWQQLDFVNQNKITLNGDKIEMSSDTSASAYFYEFPKPLTKPFRLSWEWRVNKHLPVGDPLEKRNDDYAARVYVVFQQGFFKWQVNSVNYVWASKAYSRTFWLSPYDKRSAILPRVNSAEVDTWFSEQAFPFADFPNLFDQRGRKVIGIAIMSDTDDTATSVTSTFRNIEVDATQ